MAITARASAKAVIIAIAWLPLKTKMLSLAKAAYSMQEQIAILMLDHGEWLFITADEEPERIFKSVGDAVKELTQDGWEIADGLGVVGAVLDALSRTFASEKEDHGVYQRCLLALAA